MTEEYLEFLGCQIHTHKLFATSIAKAKELTGHVVNRLYLQKVEHHYGEFNHFRPLLRGDCAPTQVASVGASLSSENLALWQLTSKTKSCAMTL
jgi:hypothetical protein